MFWCWSYQMITVPGYGGWPLAMSVEHGYMKREFPSVDWKEEYGEPTNKKKKRLTRNQRRRAKAKILKEALKRVAQASADMSR